MRALSERSLLGLPIRRAQTALGGSCAVLIYHRIAAPERDPQLHCVSPGLFERQMEVIASSFTPVSPDELADALEGGRSLPRDAIAVTMDDGYADNLTNAHPVLKRLGIPATIFVSSGLLASGRLSWVHQLEALILGVEHLPPSLQVPSQHGRLVLRTPPEEVGPVDPGWNVTMAARDARHAAYLALCDLLLDMSATGRDEALDALRDQVGEDPEPDEGLRWLSASELRTLNAEGLVRIGSHTRDHLRLSARPEEEQREQIASDKDALERMTGGPVRLLSYPYGGRLDYGDTAAAIARSAGFTVAFANHLGSVTRWTDRFRLPRVPVSRVPAEQLEAHLKRVLRGVR